MLTELQEKKLTHFFNKFDLDNNGVLEKNDFQIVVDNMSKENGCTPGSETCNQIRDAYMGFWSSMEENVGADSGQITLSEWRKYFGIVLNDKPEIFNAITNQFVDATFNFLDQDGSKMMHEHQLGTLYRCYGIDDNEAKEIFPLFDLDADGKLSKKEVLTLVTQFLSSSDPAAPGNAFMGRL